MATLYHVPTSRSLRVLWTLEEIGATVAKARFEPTFFALEQPDAVGEPQMPRGNEPRFDHGDRMGDLGDFHFVEHWLSFLGEPQ